MRAVVRSIVSEIEPIDAEESDHRGDVLAWIDSGADLWRRVKPATPPKHLVSYCALIDTEACMMLLVDHRDAELWLPTGGHVDPGEHPADAASREIREELGISPAFHPTLGRAPILVTVTQTVGISVSHEDVSLWFAFAGAVNDVLDPDDDEFVDTRWWRFDEIVHGAGTRFDPHLPRFVSKLTDTALTNPCQARIR